MLLNKFWVQHANLIKEELLPHLKGILADVLLAALQACQVGAADQLLALGQELQCVQT